MGFEEEVAAKRRDEEDSAAKVAAFRKSPFSYSSPTVRHPEGEFAALLEEMHPHVPRWRTGYVGADPWGGLRLVEFPGSRRSVRKLQPIGVFGFGGLNRFGSGWTLLLLSDGRYASAAASGLPEHVDMEQIRAAAIARIAAER